MNRHDAQRIAGSVNVLRPEWPLSSLMTLLGRAELRARPFRDVLMALTWVAADDTSTTPGRVVEAGPWWRAARAEQATFSTVTTMCAEHPDQVAWKCSSCAELTGDTDAGLATLRAALPASTQARARAADRRAADRDNRPAPEPATTGAA